MEPESEPGVDLGPDTKWSWRGLRPEVLVLFGREGPRERDLAGRPPPLPLLQAVLCLMQDRCWWLSTGRPPRQCKPLSTWAVAAWTWCSLTPGDARPVSLMEILLTTLRKKENDEKCVGTGGKTE